jgi:hypothetical protein
MIQVFLKTYYPKYLLDTVLKSVELFSDSLFSEMASGKLKCRMNVPEPTKTDLIPFTVLALLRMDNSCFRKFIFASVISA